MKRPAIIIATILAGTAIGYTAEQAGAACRVVTHRARATRIVRVHRHGRIVRQRRHYWQIVRRTVCAQAGIGTPVGPTIVQGAAKPAETNAAPVADPPTVAFAAIAQSQYDPRVVTITVLAGPFAPVPPAGQIRIVRNDRDPSFGDDATVCTLPVNLFVGFERSCVVNLVQMACPAPEGLPCQSHELTAVYESPQATVTAIAQIALQRVVLTTKVAGPFTNTERTAEACAEGKCRPPDKEHPVTQETTRGRVGLSARTTTADGTLLEPLPSKDPVSVGESELVEHRPFGGYEWTLRVGESELGRCPPNWWCGVRLLKLDTPHSDAAPWQLEVEGEPEAKMLPLTTQEATEGKLTATVHWEAALGGPGGGKFFYDSPTVLTAAAF